MPIATTAAKLEGTSDGVYSDPLPFYTSTTGEHGGIAQSIRLSHGAAARAIGTLAACSLATAGYQRCVDCGPICGRM